MTKRETNQVPNPRTGPRVGSGVGVLLLLALVAGGMAGCGNLTAGGFGEVIVDVVGDDDPGGASGQGSAAPMNGGAPSSHNQSGGVYRGTVTLELRVSLRDAEGAWHELTGGVERVEVQADGSVPVEVARRSLPEGNYDRARVDFHRAEVEVTAAPPGQGLPDGLVVVDFEGADLLVVERPVQVRPARDGEEVDRVRINLRARSWIRMAVQGEVPAATFRNAVQVTVVR
jgi:hypothetical protein